MMELVKKEIHMNQMKGKIVTQMTLDEDFNVPDPKPDVSRIILSQGDVVLEAVKQAEEKVTVSLNFCMERRKKTDDCKIIWERFRLMSWSIIRGCRQGIMCR